MGTNRDIAVIDLFAGPGGLGEGFSAYAARGSGRPYRIAMSAEMDEHAHRTLRLRSFFRQYATRGARVPEAYYNVLRGTASETDLANGRCAASWEAAEREALRAELGTPEGNTLVDDRIQAERLGRGSRPVVLLGGPPCQAYSLVGRARNRGIAGYTAEGDGRHVLYRQYLRVLCRTWPAAFVMENVKGILSSQLNGSAIFPRILEDLHEPQRAESRSKTSSADKRYTLHTLSVPRSSSLWSLQGEEKPSSFVVRSEKHGIPQKRHRVFVVGIREDLSREPLSLLKPAEEVSLESVIGDLPPLLPRVSRKSSSAASRMMTPLQAAQEVMSDAVLQSITSHCGRDVAASCRKCLRQRTDVHSDDLYEYVPYKLYPVAEGGGLTAWIRDPRIGGVCNHLAKSHMPSDLARYIFAASFAARVHRSPKLGDFPPELLPDHVNVSAGIGNKTVFADRFRVQLWGQPATTITSHLAKDGHYYIHPDPMQMRSLTVREAARIQTFPDNYFFCGPRTAQYQQVGNAVPPYLALQIAKILYAALKEAGL